MNPDPKTALERLLAEAPHVRDLARTLVTGDSEDLAQETWMHATKHGGEGIQEPRSWLSRIARNAAANLRRSRARRHTHENELPPPAPVPSSADLAAREEQRRRLVTAVDRLPEPLRAVVVLRYLDGVPATEIAQRLGLPPSTVWNRTRQALRQLRVWLDDRHGSRSAWAAPLAALTRDLEATATPLTTTGSTAIGGTGHTGTWIGAIGMTAKAKITTIAALALALASLVFLWQQGEGNPENALPAPKAQTAATASGEVERNPDRVAVPPADGERAGGDREPNDAGIAAASTGTLVVKVSLERTGQAAADVGLTLRRLGSNHRIGVWRQRTGNSGIATFAGLQPARYYLQGERGRLGKFAAVVAGETTRLERVIPLGVRVHGRVVDAAGVRLPGALVEVSAFARSDVDPFLAATTDERGEFVLDDLPTEVLIGARKHGYASSRLAFITSKPGNDANAELELVAAGGSLAGAVFGPQGRPVVDAVIRAGKGRVSGHTAGARGAPPIAGFGRTNAEGRFEIIGLPPGPQPVEVWAADLAPWRGECEIAASHTVALRVDLSPGASLEGVVRNADGLPAPRAELTIGSPSNFVQFSTDADSTGAFRFTGLPSGELGLTAEHHKFGKGQLRVQTTGNTTTRCELSITRGLELRGNVVLGNESHRAHIVVGAYNANWSKQARTDEQGNFVVPNCPESGTLTLRVITRDHERETLSEVDPRAGPVTIRLTSKAARSVHVIGRVVDEQSRPLSNALISASQVKGSGGGSGRTNSDGTFTIGPIVPGRFRLMVRAPGRPRFLTSTQELVTGERWDAGDITLPALGRARLQITGDPTDVEFRAYAMGVGGTTTIEAEGGSWRSGPMAVDRYRLFVSGPRIAARTIEFTITANQETTITVALQPGTPQEIRAEQRAVVIRQGKRVIARSWIRDATTIALAPGDYEAATTGEPRIIRQFSVGATQGPAVELR